MPDARRHPMRLGVTVATCVFFVATHVRAQEIQLTGPLVGSTPTVHYRPFELRDDALFGATSGAAASHGHDVSYAFGVGGAFRQRTARSFAWEVEVGVLDDVARCWPGGSLAWDRRTRSLLARAHLDALEGRVPSGSSLCRTIDALVGALPVLARLEPAPMLASMRIALPALARPAIPRYAVPVISPGSESQPTVMGTATTT